MTFGRRLPEGVITTEDAAPPPRHFRASTFSPQDPDDVTIELNFYER